MAFLNFGHLRMPGCTILYLKLDSPTVLLLVRLAIELYECPISHRTARACHVFVTLVYAKSSRRNYACHVFVTMVLKGLTCIFG